MWMFIKEIMADFVGICRIRLYWLPSITIAGKALHQVLAQLKLTSSISSISGRLLGCSLVSFMPVKKDRDGTEIENERKR